MTQLSGPCAFAQGISRTRRENFPVVDYIYNIDDDSGDVYIYRNI